MAKAVGISYGAMARWRWKRGLKANKPPKAQRARSRVLPGPAETGVVSRCIEANRRFMQAFERDLVTTASKHRDWPVDVDAFIRIWREVRADEVIAEIERGMR